MIKKAYSLMIKYKELIVYGVFGVLATVVDFGSYFALTRLFSINEHLSNILAQIIAILFAFFTNKFFVFNDRNCNAKAFFAQFAKFVSFRLVTLFINSALFSLMIEVLHINDIITKVFVAIIVVVLNYVFSKLFIFKKEKGKNK